MTTIGPDESWRLVWRDQGEASLFMTAGYTSTTANIEEFSTEEAAKTRAAELGLVIIAEEVV
ncbi:MAG: hypothetical protein C0621_05715 [Desulfuromonas sp.]|nr:MAG: hypothetical protein C0621_05715 [Desulfuromonas sp.]